MTDTTIYAHAVGRVRTIENRLIDRNTFERMIEARSPEEAMKTLVDSGYGSGMEAMSIRDFEALLGDELRSTYSLLRKITPDLAVIKPFLRKWDFHNSRVILKGELAGIAYENYLVDSGLVSVEELKACISERDFDKLPDILSGAITESIEAFNRTGDPQLIDLIHETAAHKQIMADVKETENDYITEYFKQRTDLLNIRTFLRVKQTGGDPGYLERVLLQEGTLGKEFFIKSLDNSYENFLSSVKHGKYGVICERAMDSYLSNGSLSEFERLMDDHLSDYVSKSRYIAVGMEPVAAYLLAKEIEITNARIILAGKINGVPYESIRERLRRTYV